MGFPGTPIIRVGYMAPNLPYPVSVYLPPVNGIDTRTNIRTTGSDLDIAVPRDLHRHEVLGKFMDAWSSLESTLVFVFSQLVPIDMADAELILPKLGTKNALSLLEGFGLRKLSPSSAARLSGLLERAGKLNTKRNVLAHGHWVLEANVVVKRGEAVLITQFLREVIPDDPEDAKAMGNPRNQKSRVRYAFTSRRIEAATRDADALNREICNYLEEMESKELSVSELMQKLILKRPYRVSYS